MKQMIIAVVALTATASAGVTFLLLSRSVASRKRKPCMTFAELYEDNICNGSGSLFD